MLADAVPEMQIDKKVRVRVRVVSTNASVHCAVKRQPELKRNNLYVNVRLKKKKTESKLPLRIGLPFKEQHAADVARTQGKKAAHDASDWGELASRHRAVDDGWWLHHDGKPEARTA
jgi:hypothetical protein